MITRIEATDYLCLRSVKQELGPFQILVGPNGSGKSVFLDVVAFLATLMSEGLLPAIRERTASLYDLVWGRRGSRFKMAIGARVPEPHRHVVRGAFAETIRYELTIWLDPDTDTPIIEEERVCAFADGGQANPPVLVLDRGRRTLSLSSGSEGSSQTGDLGTEVHSALPYGPCREVPVLAWLFDQLRQRVLFVKLHVDALRKPSPPQPKSLRRWDGSSLAREVNRLQEKSPRSFDDWVAHVRTALPDLEEVSTVLRPEDMHRCLMVQFANKIRVPSWNLSEGTLRLLALTVLAYLPEPAGVYLIEEPENGVHPSAIETIYQSLSSMYESQVMVATHSPVWLALAQPDELLCFRRTPEGTQIVRGSEHPALRDWKGEVNLAEYFAAGVLG